MDKINLNLSLTPSEAAEVVLLLKELDAYDAMQNTEPMKISTTPAVVAAEPESPAPAIVEAEPEPVPAAEEPPEKPVTKEALRALGVKLTKAGRTEDLKKAFGAFGAAKLSEVKDADYPALKKVLEDMIDG